jgi:hypothetical protein
LIPDSARLQDRRRRLHWKILENQTIYPTEPKKDLKAPKDRSRPRAEAQRARYCDRQWNRITGDGSFCTLGG